MNTALTIAGSDSSGGAGIQADLKTMIMNGVYGMSAITALTAQNTMGVKSIFEVTPQFLKEEIDSIFEDIIPDAVKIGMVASSPLVEIIAERLDFYKAKNIVIDPVMVSTSGAGLMELGAVKVLKEKLFPLSILITPNFREAEVLSGIKIKNEEDMIIVANKIREECKCNVLLKGGHNKDNANDLLSCGDKNIWFKGKRIDNPNIHGTGCTLSSAITANLAKGFSLEQAVLQGKNYIKGAISAMLDLGKGSGPMDHGFKLKASIETEGRLREK